MWSYYGSKCKIAKHYPTPQEQLIIEPFAGAAWYSVNHKEHDIWVNEKNATIAEIWKWLIKYATQNEILDNKDFNVGDNINDLILPTAHKNLLGFIINRGSTRPCNIVQKWSCQVKNNPKWASTVAYQLKRIARNLEDIRHWEPIYGDYKNLPNVRATWFIDPPYQNGGDRYVENKIDYKELAEWCKTRRGQVIVCENTDADWLPFKPLIEIQGQKKKTTEAMWIN